MERIQFLCDSVLYIGKFFTANRDKRPVAGSGVRTGLGRVRTGERQRGLEGLHGTLCCHRDTVHPWTEITHKA